MRPKGPGLYEQLNLPARNRIDVVDVLKQTHRDRDDLSALVNVRRARDLGAGPMETLRRHFDEEGRRVARRLAELEKKGET
jgi:hypothetical protein